MKAELEQFYILVQEIKIAMMTTRRYDRHLRDLQHNPDVNLAYCNPSNMEWISVSGLAVSSRDRQTIGELWADDCEMWLPDKGDPRHGTPDDPASEPELGEMHQIQRKGPRRPE